MSAKPGAFITRPGIAACHLGRGGEMLPLKKLTDQDWVAAALRERGMRADAAAAKADMFAESAASLGDPDVVDEKAFAIFIPGRIEVLGKHTDYCGGRSLLCTVERGFCFVVKPRVDATINIFAANKNERASFELASDIVPTPGHWTNYPMTVARRVASNFGADLKGCDIAFASDLPAAAGLSSSSAFIVGTFLALSAVNRLETTGPYQSNIDSTADLANYLGCCENGSTFGTLIGSAGVGTFGGSQDHTAILCCKSGMLSMFSFCPVVHEGDVRLPEHIALHVCSSGVIAEKTGSAMAKYNAVSLRARKIVELWNAATGEWRSCLAHIIATGQDTLGRLRGVLAQNAAIDAELKLSERLDQFLIESNRLIPAAYRIIGSGAWDALGALIEESQGLSETNLMNQVPETIAIQRQLRDAGAIASSAFGAGFGGSVWGMFIQR